MLDIGCAFSMLLLQCHGSGGGGKEEEHVNVCVWKEVNSAFGGDGGVGDLFCLALARCIVTSLLLWIGIQYGQMKKSNQNNEHQGGDEEEVDDQRDNLCQEGQHNNDTASSSLTTPLLLLEEINENHNNRRQEPAEGDGAQSQSIKTNLTKKLCSCCRPTSKNQRQEDEAMTNNGHETKTKTKTIKNTTLVLLFITSTFFQVYAGIKVSTFHFSHNNNNSDNNDDDDDDNNNNNDHESNAFTNPAIPPLMCLTILWINIISYIFRVLLEELTRHDALFLPPTVHRHPVFYEESRGINLHWCDICRTRIVSSSTLESSTTGCYRCSLCDFDICMSCAKREDAAIVGENLLRGDSGVRVEQTLDNKTYFARSWVFIKPQLCLLGTSLVLLTCSSVTKLALPHFQGRIIDMVIPDAEGNHDTQGFLRYIKIYVVFMIVQGAVSTTYSAIFTLVSRRLKFTIRNSLFQR